MLETFDWIALDLPEVHELDSGGWDLKLYVVGRESGKQVIVLLHWISQE